ncbi:hypothetical protein HP437_00580 (plasmid) [Serratia marcescens]|jgi:hypothetical protein|uniref:hypothetical protein n=1 Tax=Serratia marcescens TaxID=615 RepID=UPI0015D69A80|nr:hypothetical protein [Serratia marcescens]MBN5380580.1 hypothetical protein [Serratia marcescens]QLJ63758.1 hypothetical protein HP437_00580 [Serratia marcescens]HEB0104076.1 hypothetical protein [Serratia marcescens]
MLTTVTVLTPTSKASRRAAVLEDNLCRPGVPSARRLRNRCHEQGSIFLVDMRDVVLDAITIDADHVFVLQ